MYFFVILIVFLLGVGRHSQDLCREQGRVLQGAFEDPDDIDAQRLHGTHRQMGYGRLEDQGS